MFINADALSSGMIDAHLFIMFTELMRHSNSLTSIERNNITKRFESSKFAAVYRKSLQGM